MYCYVTNTVDVNEDIQKEEIEKILDYSNKSIMKIDFTDFNLRFTDVKYGVRRDKDMMIVYDENAFVDTNIYGYEIAVDEYGLVVDVGVNVTLVNNGYIVSGHGVSSALLQEVNVGDVCVYVDESIYIYKERNIDEFGKVYLKLLDVKNEIEFINDIIQK